MTDDAIIWHVAKNVMGWKEKESKTPAPALTVLDGGKRSPFTSFTRFLYRREDDGVYECDAWNPFLSELACAELLDRMAERGHFPVLRRLYGGGWECAVLDPQAKLTTHVTAVDPDRKRAVVMAAYRAVGGEE